MKNSLLNLLTIHHTFNQLKAGLQRPLPGISAFAPLSIRQSRLNQPIPNDARQSAVCLLLYRDKNALKLVYILRSIREDDSHSGQISFPGGAAEDQDSSLEHTALRELYEETGIHIDSQHILGKLTPLFIPVSNFYVHPYVAGIDYKPSTLLQASEVQDIFSIDIKILQTLKVMKKTMHVRGLRLKDVPYFDLLGKTLWGATAMITNEFIQILQAADMDYD